MTKNALKYGLAAACFLFVTAATAKTKIAVVDLQGALLRTEDGMSARATLAAYTKKRQSELDRRQKDLMREQGELRAQAGVLSVRALQKRYELWQRKMMEAQTKAVEYNRTLQKKEASMMQPIIQKMMKAVRRVATKRGFDMVLARTAVPYVRGDLDITDMVIQRYNGGGGSSKSDDDSKDAKKDE